jgi:TRAP-type transport system periplasmic protein
MSNPAHLDAFKAFGASPVPMDYSEVYTAMETGVIDGMEAAHSNYYSKKFYEVAPNYAIVDWMRLVGPILMSKIVYDKMPPDLQKLVSDTAKETALLERELYEEACVEKLDLFIEEGINITYPDVAPFKEAAKTVYDKWADRVGGYEKIEELLNFEY